MQIADFSHFSMGEASLRGNRNCGGNVNGLPASCISDNSQNWTPVLVLHGCCPDIHRLPVGFGQSDKSSVPVACFGETAHASSRDACCGPVDLIGGHAYVRTGLHAFERHQLFASRRQIDELDVGDTPQSVDGHLLVARHAGGDAQINDAGRHVRSIVDCLLIIQTLLDFGHITGGFMAFLVPFLNAFVDGAAVASNLVGGDFRRFDFASDACGDRIGSAGSSDFHESSNPQVVWIRDAALVEIRRACEADAGRVFFVDIPLGAVHAIVVQVFGVGAGRVIREEMHVCVLRQDRQGRRVGAPHPP